MLPPNGLCQDSRYKRVNPMFAQNSPLNQVCWRHRRSLPFVSHGQEFYPVATETPRVDSSVYNESPVGTASSFLPQGQTCFPFSHVVTDVDHLYQQQMEEPAGHNTAVPRAGEAKCSAVTQT